MSSSVPGIPPGRRLSLVSRNLPAGRFPLRRGEPRIVIITPLRAVHNGSVNDYAVSAIGGMVVVISVLAWL
jgi:hypothetical protein